MDLEVGTVIGGELEDAVGLWASRGPRLCESRCTRQTHTRQAHGCVAFATPSGSAAPEPVARMTRAESRPNWSPLEHVPADKVFARLIDTADRRWTADRIDNDHDIKALEDWLWETGARQRGRGAEFHRSRQQLGVLARPESFLSSCSRTARTQQSTSLHPSTQTCPAIHHGPGHSTREGSDSGRRSHHRCAGGGPQSPRRSRPREPAILLQELAGW